MVKLSESTVYIRTKCSVEAVKKLNLWGCNIDDISLCQNMPSLEVLSLSVNRVETLSSLKSCSRLRELYLRKNNLQSLSELDHLKDLKNLRVLWIDDNPCTEGVDYRSKVIRLLPQLTTLDDRNTSGVDDSDDSVPECDMQSARTSRSSTMNDIASRTVTGRAIVDTVMKPQMVHYGDTSDEERVGEERRAQRGQRMMSQSVYGALPEDDWGDFNIEDDDFACQPADFFPMSASMYETPARSQSQSQSRLRQPSSYSRSVSVPRRRGYCRQPSMSPARENRLSKIMSAVSVLLDELDAEGLRDVVEEAQSRMKKQR